ncbi:MAG: phosphoribosylglycinamide formyltransferase [Alphaproteobacteria bacterium]|nr:phosphoribosylglycinamide formyltransferase [Alphaproteobacteria bacterium]
MSTPHLKARVAILISGRGSNMEAIAKAARGTDFPAKVALVLSNRPDAEGLKRAEKLGIKTAVLDHTQFTTREAFDGALHQVLLQEEIDFICLAGFMRLLTPGFVASWEGRIMNIHPSLLPSYKGLNAIEQAIEAGAKITGCTVHAVTADMDSGPIIGQCAVPVLAGDTPETLAKRIQAAEHRLYPQALWLVLSGQHLPAEEDEQLISF